MIIFIVKLTVITTIWNLGIEIVFSDGMALDKVRKWAENKTSKWYEVVFYCVWCRPSIHSLIGYAAAIGFGVINSFSWKLVIAYPFVVAATSLISGLIWSAYKYTEIKHKYYNHLEQHAFFDLKDRKINHSKNKNNGTVHSKKNDVTK